MSEQVFTGALISNILSNFWPNPNDLIPDLKLEENKSKNDLNKKHNVVAEKKRFLDWLFWIQYPIFDPSRTYAPRFKFDPFISWANATLLKRKT